MLSVAPGRPLPQPLHEKGIKLYQEFCLVGGMPEPLQIWIETNDIKACLKTQQDLLATYREDFHKYGREIDARLLNRVLLSVAEQLGNKFVYSMVDSGLQTNGVKKAIMLLFQAKLCSRIAHAAANGLPLGAQSNDKFFKALMVDVGLISALLGLSGEKRSKLDTLLLSNKGGIAEQFAGQHLRALESPLMEPRLYYWQRTGGRLGEIDYIIQHGSNIVPIEVKSGTAGSMKSLHQFMAEKKLTMAVRFDMNHPSLEEVNVRTTTGQQVQYRLLSLPLYLVERVGYLLGEIAGSR
jgi:predicted AAA+ superfamily ATPase